MKKTVGDWSDVLDYLPDDDAGSDLYFKIGCPIDHRLLTEEVDIDVDEKETELINAAETAKLAAELDDDRAGLDDYIDDDDEDDEDDW